MKLRAKELNVLRATFGRFPAVREVKVFGSRATDTARRASDLDLAIFAPGGSGKSYLGLYLALMLIFIFVGSFQNIAPAGGTNPAYSHDGTTIVFSGRRATRVALYTMSATSGESGGLTALTDTNVVTTTGRDVEPWYVNGTTVVYSSNQNTPNMALWQVDTGTKVATKLAEQPGYDMMWAAPDPTGSGIIVYQRKDAVSGRSQIWKRAADGTLSALIPGSDDGNDYGGPSYKPDGSLILFHSNRGGDYDIWSISSTGGTPTQITNTNDSAGFPVFKPDSTKIGFIRGNEFWTMDPTGTNQTRITQVFR